MVNSLALKNEVDLKRVFRTWWPLAASWLLMSLEMPALSAIIARLADPEINLAAYGGIVFPMALIVESPIIMLLSASTALSTNLDSYKKLFRFMMIAGAVMTAVHVLIAFTPAYYFVARQLIGLPDKVVEPGRLGLMLITPWTWSIAYRRFQQGVLIRFGHSDAVGAGTVIRLASGGLVLALGYFIGSFPGVAVGAVAQAIAVICEAAYSGLRVRPVLKYELPVATPEIPWRWNHFAGFYIPLAMTSLLGLLWQPMGSAALSRMPDPLVSLAVWPVVSGFIFIFRSFGFALNEVVVALLDEEGSFRNLRRFVFTLAGFVTVLQLVTLITPFAQTWFAGISALPVNLASYAKNAFWLAIPMASLTVFQSWFQGAIVNGKKTRAIPEATALFVGVYVIVAVLGIIFEPAPGLYIGMVGFVLANAAQAIWLGIRSQPIMGLVRRRDEG